MNMTKSIIKRLLLQNDKSVGSRLKARRRELGVSQVELAKKLRVCQAEISNIERGAKKVIPVLDYCEALNIKPQFLIAGK